MRRNKFSLSHYKLTTFNCGELIPVSWWESLPGDTMRCTSSILIMMQPLLAPVMHPIQIRIHNWFVPMRLIRIVTGKLSHHDTGINSPQLNVVNL